MKFLVIRRTKGWQCCVMALSVFIVVNTFSCKKADKRALYVIGFSQCVGSDLWRRTMLDEMKMELSFHPDAKFLYEDAEGNSQKQISQVEKLLNSGIDLLIISPNEAQPLTGIVQRAYNKGIPVIVIDRKTSNASYTAYVGADNYQIGKMAGEYMATILKGKGNIIEVMGLQGSSPTIERERGFNDGIRKFQNLHIIKKVYGDWLETKAIDQLSSLHTNFSNIDGIFAHNDVMALGSRLVINKSHLKNKVEIIGIDALPGNGGGLQMIASKSITASLVYPTGGKEAITTAFDILNRESFEKENILQSLIIDSTNVQLMKLQLSKINNQQKDIDRQKILIDEQRVVYDSQQVVLNVIVISLVLALVFGGLAFYSLMENRKINKSLETKNDEILQQRNQLIEMSARAEVLTEAKLNFFTNISHEFRTPLTLILSPVEDMIANEKLNITAGKSLKMIHKNIFRLLRLVNQLIDYRKLEYDKQQINASPNNIIEFIREIMISFQEVGNKRNISLTMNSNTPEITVWYDVNLLDKVIFNILSNAFKFTNENGRIQITCNVNDNQSVDIAVTDNGTGMDKYETDHIFEQFYQAQNGINKGSGLGLALSKEIVALHHGKISVESKKWQGTTFTINLPLGGNHLEHHEPNKNDFDNEIIHERSKYYTVDLENSPATFQDLAFNAPKEYSILIIEDNIDLNDYLAEKLGLHYDIYTSTNGADGLTQTFERVPDLIISDVVLPGISGKKVTTEVKSDVRTSHIPVILLTAQVSIEQQIDGLTSLADAYILKPFSFDYLLATIRNLIKGRILLKEHFVSDVSDSNTPVSKTLDKKFINDFAGIVEQNLSNENLNVDEICRLIGVSRIQLYRKVKALLNCSVSDYILNRRLKKAKYLLINENYSISEITYMVGFSTPNYFSTVFKAKYGYTPTEFKKKQHS